MTKNIKKKIIENSEFTYDITLDSIIFKISCLGTESSISMTFNSFDGCDFSNFNIDDSIKNILVNSLIANNEFFEKFERIENRKRNLDSLL